MINDNILKNPPSRLRSDYHLKLFIGKDKDWWWSQTDKRNHEIVGACHEGFSRRIDCHTNLYLCTGWATIDEVDTGAEY